MKLTKQEKTEDAIMKVLLVDEYIHYIDTKLEPIEYNGEYYTAWQISGMIEEYAENNESKWYDLVIYLCEKLNFDKEFKEEKE